MQLNMGAPMDIGLEQQDGMGMEMFDLGEVEGGKERRGVSGGRLDSDGEPELSDDDDDMDREDISGSNKVKNQRQMPMQIIPDGADDDEDDEDVTDDERKTRRLEESLDLLYESFQQTKLERDHKHKVKQQRLKRALEEGGEFKGIGSGSDADTDAESEESEGDFDPAPQPSSDEDSSDDEDEAAAKPEAVKAAPAKRARAAPAPVELDEDDKADGLLKTLKKGKVLSTSAKSRQAAMWFDQPAFKGLPGGLESLLGGADESASDDEAAAGGESDEDDEDMGDATWVESDEEASEDEASSESDDDFDGARPTFEEDEAMEEEADIDAQEKEEIEKAERIASASCSLSTSSSSPSRALSELTSIPLFPARRGWSDDGRGDDARAAARQPRAHQDAARRRGLQPAHGRHRRRRPPDLVHRRRAAPLPAQHPRHQGRRAGDPRQAARAQRAPDQESRRGQGAQADAQGAPAREGAQQGPGHQRRRGQRPHREGEGGEYRKGARQVGRRVQGQAAREEGRRRARRQPRHQGPPQGRQGQVQDGRPAHEEGGARPQAHRQARPQVVGPQQGEQVELSPSSLFVLLSRSALSLSLCRRSRARGVVCNSIVAHHRLLRLARARSSSAFPLARSL